MGGDLQRGSTLDDKHVQQSITECFVFAIYTRKKWLKMNSNRKANARQVSGCIYQLCNPLDYRAAEPWPTNPTKICLFVFHFKSIFRANISRDKQKHLSDSGDSFRFFISGECSHFLGCSRRYQWLHLWQRQGDGDTAQQVGQHCCLALH